jgi:hypothetical protein
VFFHGLIHYILNSLFTQNIDRFKNQFITHLKKMLDSDKLGAFILVLANSQQDSEVRQALHADIESAFGDIKKRFDDIKETSPQDDVDVFEQLPGINLSDIPIWKTRKEGPWDIVCNTIRKLRPARASAQVLNSIKKDFDASGFHFNKTFLKPEILWQGGYRDIQLRVLYNKFPFADYHLLIVVSPEDERAQLLDQVSHKLIYDLVQQCSERLAGFGVGFNSLAAGASVNHLHFQGFFRQVLLPIEDACWKHNGGEDEYPLTVYRYHDAVSAWAKIKQFIEQDVAFNCLYRADACYVVPRKYQGTVALPDWLKGAGWLDVAGVMTVSDEAAFHSITTDLISRSLKQLDIT